VVAHRYALIVTTQLDGYFLVVTTKLAKLDELERALHDLEQHEAPLVRVTLRLAPTNGNPDAPLFALLGFADARGAMLRHAEVRQLALALEAQLIDLAALDGAARAQLQRHLDRHPLRADATRGVAKAFNEVRRLTAPAPLLRLDFDDLDQLFATWATAIAEGGLWVPSARPPRAELFRLDLCVAGQEMQGSTGTVLADRGALRSGKPGFWLEVVPSEELKGLFDRRARERRQGRPSEGPPPGVVRQAPRFDTRLEVRFDDVDSLAAQWASDISHGGMFICSANPPDLRDRLDVRITLPQGGELTIGAEVVHRIISGTRTGVGVQFLPGQDEALAPLIALINDYQRRQPRVLVIDDEAIWRSTLARALTSLGCEVQLACDGHEGLLKLIEGYFDLDLVILDLHMPNLDGRGLIERVRQEGGDDGLKLFLFSAAPPEELAALAMPGLATGVFSKLDSIDSLTARIARELGLPIPGLPRTRVAA
jgi:CheY-like chemotaxis protein